MNEKYIKKLIRLVEESDIDSLEVSSWGRRVKIIQRAPTGSNGHANGAVVYTSATPSATAPPPASPPAASQASASETPAADETGRLVAVKSPMVGTFYAAPAPDAQPYVSLNEKITAGQVVCIVEAMKLMNEIESEVSGRVAKIMVENAQPVEFGQVLFYIDPAG
ncbi:MAG: acetyl-CoA carboxylase biotin carboxyl carrier protein [candidate division Zixibacteria bacterium]|nr:acetyl-CoA carboxylase biotin carboxyl carrier protein [candidate division Zixibacteria bacterium]